MPAWGFPSKAIVVLSGGAHQGIAAAGVSPGAGSSGDTLGWQGRAWQPGPVPPLWPRPSRTSTRKRAGPGPGWDVGLLVGQAQRGPWLGRAGQGRGGGQLKTSLGGESLGQGLMAPGAEMGSWALGRVGGGPGRAWQGLLVLLRFPDTLT